MSQESGNYNFSLFKGKANQDAFKEIVLLAPLTKKVSPHE